MCQMLNRAITDHQVAGVFLASMTAAVAANHLHFPRGAMSPVMLP
jgi:hypothetical protein